MPRSSHRVWRAIALLDVVLLSIAVGAVAGRAPGGHAPGTRLSSLTRSQRASVTSLTATSTPPKGPAELLFARRINESQPPTEVLAIQADGSGLHPLQGLAALVLPPMSYSHDRLAFSKPLSTTGVGRAVECGVHDCSISRTVAQENGIAIANLDGTNERLLTQGGYDTQPVFSPNGTRIAFRRHVERHGTTADVVGVVDAFGRGLRELLPPAGASDESPAWSPDGRWIAVRRVSESGPPTIVLLDTQGGPARTIATGEFSDPSWAHDGRRLAATRRRLVAQPGYPPDLKLPTGDDVWTLYADGSAPTQVTRLAGVKWNLEASYCGEHGGSVVGLWHPLWSPDDRYIAFVSSYRHLAQFGRQRDVMVVRPDGTGLRTVYATARLACPHDNGPEVVDLLGWRQ